MALRIKPGKLKIGKDLVKELDELRAEVNELKEKIENGTVVKQQVVQQVVQQQVPQSTSRRVVNTNLERTKTLIKKEGKRSSYLQDMLK